MADVVFSSSGSTGDVKSIVRKEESLRADAALLLTTFPELWNVRPYVVATVHAEHMYGALWVERAPRMAGCNVHAGVVLSVEEIVGLADESKPLLLITTPSFLEKARRHPDFPRLRGVLHGIVTSGSMLSSETALSVAEITGVCPLEIYGSTETGTVAWRRRTEGEEWTIMEGVSTTVTEEGLIAVASPFAMSSSCVLGDLVDLIDGRHLLLKGRVDRQVKVLEQFVSLGKVESAFASHHYVSRVRVEALGKDVPRLGALIELSADGIAAIAQGTYAQGATALREHVRAALRPHEIPRRIRFVRMLPTNAQGKTTVDDVRHALSAWCQEPIVKSWQATDSQLTVRMVFPSDMTCFKGHFPSVPILPGVAQLYFLRHFTQQAFADFPDVCTYRRLKFKKLVSPGVDLEMAVVRKPDGAFAFSFGEASSGEVVPKC